MKKVLFLALSFPDVSKTTHLYTDLMHTFLEKGHEVLVIAPFGDDSLKKSKIVVESGMKILRVPTLNLFGGGKIEKGLSNILLPLQYKKALKRHNISLDFDLILMPTPPITLINVALWIKRKSKGKLYLILRDIFPQNAVDLKMMRNTSLIYKYFRKMEIRLYKNSDSIGCMSPANIDFVKKHNPYLDFNKLHLLINWEYVYRIEESFNSETLKEKHGLTNKVIAIFGGNIGLPQRLENIINLAEECQDIKDLVFFIIGTGTEKSKIEKMISQLNLRNIILKDSLPRKEYNKLLSIADIGLISLNQDFTIPNYPSKVNSYYCFKKPVLASVDVHTDFGRIQEKIGCGFWSPAGDTQALKENLLKLYKSKDLREKLGQKGHAYMITNLTPEKAYDTVCEHT